MLERTIVGSFSVRGEATSRELPTLQVVFNTLAAHTRLGTSAIGARTFAAVLFFLAFHQWTTS